jgi:hypothetical protein
MFISTMKSTQCHDPEGRSLKLIDMDTLTFTVFHFKSRGTRSRFPSYHIGFICDEMDLSSRGIACGFPHKKRDIVTKLYSILCRCVFSVLVDN